MEIIKNAENVYVVVSGITNVPFAVCDKETYDDTILMYEDEEFAKKRAMELLEENYLVQILKVDKKNRLPFLVSLYLYGINGILFETEEGGKTIVQLEDVVKLPEESDVEKGKVRVGNPEFHLTALYFMQELRRIKDGKITEEVMELQEEMTSHFRKGKYIIPTVEGKGVPIMKLKTGEKYHPIFTDAQEYQKFVNFNKKTTFKGVALEADKVVGIISKEADGVVVNPFGVNVQMKLQAE